MATVKFTFEDKNIAPKVVENVEEGISILEVAEDNDVHLNHNCGGVCACSTCHVYIEKGEDDLEEISDKEEDFIYTDISDAWKDFCKSTLDFAVPDWEKESEAVREALAQAEASS